MTLNINWQVMILISLIIFVAFLVGYSVGIIYGFRQAAIGQARLVASLFAGLKLVEDEEDDKSDMC